MTAFTLDPLSSWLLVAGVLVAAGMVGLAIIHDGQRARRQAARDVDARRRPRTRISPGELRRRDWLLEQLDRPELTLAERQLLNAELTHLSPPWEHLREAAL